MTSILMMLLNSVLFPWKLQRRAAIIRTVTTRRIINPLSPGYLMVLPPESFSALIRNSSNKIKHLSTDQTQRISEATTKYRKTTSFVCTVNYQDVSTNSVHTQKLILDLRHVIVFLFKRKLKFEGT